MENLKYELEYLINIEKGANKRIESIYTDLITAIWNRWKGKAKEGYEVLRTLETPSGDEIHELYRNKMSVEFPLEIEESVSKAILNTYKYSKGHILGVFTPTDYKSIKYLEEHTNWWIKNYYDEHVGKEITGIIREGLKERFSTKDIGKKIGDLLTGKYVPPNVMPPDRYWEGLARNALTRSRMSSKVQTFVENGVDEYEIIGTEDGRICAICRAMHGRIFKVKRAQQFFDKFNTLKTPDEVKTKLPWIKSYKEIDKPTSELDLSHSLPDFHFECRCDVIHREFSFEEEVQMLLNDEDYAKKLPEDLLLITNNQEKISWKSANYDEAKMILRIARKEKIPLMDMNRFIKKSNWLSNSKLEEHYINHMDEFPDINSVEEYRKLSYKVLTDGELWGIIDSRAGYPVIYAIKEVNGKNIFTVLNVKGSQIATTHAFDEFSSKFKKSKEFVYKIRSGKILKFNKKGRKVIMDTKRTINWYKANVTSCLNKEKYWEKLPDGRLIPPYDTITVMYTRDEINNNYSDFSDSEIAEIKAIDEMLLRNPAFTRECLEFAYDCLDNQSMKRWWWHFDKIKSGEIKVTWNEENKIYTIK